MTISLNHDFLNPKFPAPRAQASLWGAPRCKSLGELQAQAASPDTNMQEENIGNWIKPVFHGTFWEWMVTILRFGLFFFDFSCVQRGTISSIKASKCCTWKTQDLDPKQLLTSNRKILPLWSLDLRTLSIFLGGPSLLVIGFFTIFCQWTDHRMSLLPNDATMQSFWTSRTKIRKADMTAFLRQSSGVQKANYEQIRAISKTSPKWNR